jgi:hypothetical protein
MLVRFSVPPAEAEEDSNKQQQRDSDRNCHKGCVQFLEKKKYYAKKDSPSH